MPASISFTIIPFSSVGPNIFSKDFPARARPDGKRHADHERRQGPDVILYDVLGDVVCGGFAMPIRGGYADHVMIVTSAEQMALFAASNIACAIESFGKRGYVRLAGLIHNHCLRPVFRSKLSPRDLQ